VIYLTNDLPDIKLVLEHYGARVGRDHGQVNLKCPFHSDTHQSGTANLDENIFICFACGVKGNSIQLVAHKEGVSIREAKRIAEEFAGVSSPEVFSKHLSGRRLPSATRHKSGSSTAGAIRRSRGA